MPGKVPLWNTDMLVRTVKGAAARIRRLEAALEELRIGGRQPSPAQLVVAAHTAEDGYGVTNFFYEFEIQLAANVTPGQDTITIEPSSTFIATRLSAHWRPTAGANANRFTPWCSADPLVFYAGAPVDRIDFLWELTEGTAGRGRQQKSLPSDMLWWRHGMELGMPFHEVYRGQSQLTMTVTPIIANPSTGTLYIILWGYQGIRG